MNQGIERVFQDVETAYLSDSFWDSGLIQCLTTAGSSAPALHVFWAAQVWPDRQRLNHETKEFEAESVSFMVCQRQGIQTTSPEYILISRAFYNEALINF